MGETAMDCGIKHLQRKIQNKTRLFGNKDTHFIPEILFFRILSLPPHLFTRRKPSAAPVFQIRFRFTPQLCIAVPRTLHIFCTFVRHATERELTERYDEKIPDPAPADRLLVAGRGTGEAAGPCGAETQPPHRNHRGRFDRRTAGTAAQHAQHRDRQGHHLPAQKRLVRTDDALPHAEPSGAVVRRRLHAHQDRSPRQTAAAALRRLHLFAQTGLLGPAGIHLLRHRAAARRRHEHRARRHRLLRAQRHLEHRLRADQDQGQPRADQLVERPAIRRPEHRQQRIQPRPRLRVLRRIQHAPRRGLQPLGKRLRHAGRRPQLGQFADPEGWPIRGVWNSIRWDASSRRATSSRATTNSRSG